PDPDLAGYYGPDSMSWRLGSESVVLLGGARAILMQVAHPLVAAGVGQHSDYSRNPWRRSNQTLAHAIRLTFGTRAEARAAAQTINRMHRHVVGTLETAAGPYTDGMAYRAQQQDLLLWVFATLTDTMLYLYPLLVRPLSRAEQERYYQEARAGIALLGLPPSAAPETLASFRAYMREMLEGDQLAITQPARDVARMLMRMPAPFVLRPLLDLTSQITIGLLPPRVRTLYGFTWGHRRQTLFDLWAASTRHL